MRVEGKSLLILTVFLFFTLFLYCCGESDNSRNTTMKTEIATPLPLAEPVNTPKKEKMTPTPTLVPSPIPTPTPNPPTFLTITSNMGLMSPEEIERYGKQLAGRQIDHWTGWVYDHYKLPSGEIAVAVLMMTPDKERPDVSLYDLPEAILNKLEKKQPIRFSGTIKGIGVIGVFEHIINIGQTTIHGYE